MKQYSILFFLLLISIGSFALDVNKSFGIKNFGEDEKMYQQYVGQTIDLLLTDSVALWKKYGVKNILKYKGSSFTIQKIDVIKSEKWFDGIPNHLKINVVENGGKNNITIKASLDFNLKGFSPLDWLPIRLTQAFEEHRRELDKFKHEQIGKIIEVPGVRDQYKVIDAYDDRNIKIRNTRTNQTINCYYLEAEDRIFEFAEKQKLRFSLSSVERPKDTSIRYGEAITTQEDGIYKYLYSDSIVKIVIFGHEKGFHFVLENLMRNSIKVIWNESAFVGVNGITSKIVHSGVKYSEMGNNQPPTVIIGGAKLIDSVIPVDNVEYDNTENDWITNPILSFQDLTDNLGEVRLMLPIQVKDVVNEYIFTFKVTNDYMLPVQDI